MPYIIVGVVIFVILALVIFLKSAQGRGKVGELKVRCIIGSNNPGKRYVINDLTLANNGKTAQIDHVVINSNGVFIIETKNYSGTIYGSENQLEWTQVLAYGKVKNKFYNPLKQNATHVYCVSQIIGNLPIHSFVVFTKNNVQNIDSSDVIPLSRLRQRLKQGCQQLTLEQMEKAYDELISSKIEVSRKEHINNIKEQQLNLERGICPRCGAKLVLRDGKYGSFWGCSNYPKCRFIKKK